MAIGPVVFDIRYITNEYTKICGLKNLVSTEEHCLQLIYTPKNEYLKKTRKYSHWGSNPSSTNLILILYHLGCTAHTILQLQLTILILL